ncbi:hypothetical protein AB0O34_06805 [Sphaerisporangium sp. NPDC088356]|uniref:hypothetical protein n=1 Tax=Sphaerisporangium sp. NPDC088356 TaxID=3154871 RepID=UPI00343951AA
MLSDGWTPGKEPAHTQRGESSDLVWADHQRAEDHEQPESLDGYEHLYRPEVSHDDELPEGHERPDDENWDPEHELYREGEPGSLGLGWTDEDDQEEEKGSQNKRLIFAIVGIVMLAVAGGWIVSSSVGSKQEAACSTPGDCASVGEQNPALTDGPTAGPSLTDPATESSAGPDDTTASPSETPTPAPTTSQVRVTHQPTSRPSPTRTRVHSPKPSPTSSSRPQQPDDPDPKPSPTPPPTTQAPQLAPSPTNTQNGGLLDWLF